MSEFRQDRTSGAWVIVAPERGLRPRARPEKAAAGPSVRDFDPSCPFCPGNESMLPGIIAEVPGDAPPGWRTRVVPNKYPAVADTALGPSRSDDCRGQSLAGKGYHEVIIETPHHGADLTGLPADEVGRIMGVYRTRYQELARQPAIRAVSVFRNRGGRAGASLSHPHSQVMAVALAPPRHVAAAAWAHAYYEEHGRCVTCDYVACELEDGRRILDATERFVVLVPFAAQSPFEQWIVPRHHRASFVDAEAELMELGRLLQGAIRRLDVALEDPPYNYAVESALVEDEGSPFVHWRLKIAPDVVIPGGFEFAAGMCINPSLPEDDAATLRAAGRRSDI